jgi:Ca-activated chloride channel family protein
MLRRIAAISVATVLSTGCFNSDEPVLETPPGAQAVVAALSLPPQPVRPLDANTQQHLRRQLAEWQRAATSGTLLLHEAGSGVLEPGPTLSTQVEITVSGPLARVIVSQRFHNPGGGWAEGIYVFPLPDDAAVDHMSVYTDTSVLEGRIEEKAEARKTYERAKREGRQAGLVEQERPNVFTTHVANIPPDSEVTVEIAYQQSVKVDDGTSSLRFPTVVAPRYVPGLAHSELEPLAPAGSPHPPEALRLGGPTRLPGRDPIQTIEIAVDLAAGFEIDFVDSPYHEIFVEDAPDGVRVHLAASEAPADRDFELRWAPAAGAEPAASLFSESFSDEHYALLMVTPPRVAEPGHDPQPRDVIFVIDTSGSMAGQSLLQAKHALELAIERLRPDDRFNVIEFNSRTNSLFASALFADRRNVAAALEFVDGLVAQGGTEILPAIAAALADGDRRAAALRQIVFLTDGSVANEVEVFDEIVTNLGDSRLFAIGIGSAPNSYFMRKIAELGRGSSIHIGDPDEVAERMDVLFRKLESVVLRDIELEFTNGEIVEQYPPEISDLYFGEPIVVALRLDAPLDGVVVHGRTGDTRWQTAFDRNDVQERPGLHVRWARSKIAALMDARIGRSNPRELDELREETVAVALDHHLVSAYTSLVAVDVSARRRDDESQTSHRLVANLPAGWHSGTVFGMAGTASSAPLRCAIGLAIVLLSLWIRPPRPAR